MSSKQPPLGSAALQAPSQTTQVVHVSPSTCHDLSLFKEILKEYRRIDDTIVMRLNRANAVMRDKQRTQDLTVPNIQEQACLQMWRELVANWSQRTKLVDYCVMVVDQSVNEKKQAMEEQSNDPVTRRRTQAAIYEDEVKRTQVHNELRVESIIRKRAVEAFRSRCQYFSPPASETEGRKIWEEASQ